MKKYLLLLTLIALFPATSFAASRFWVGGTGTWDATDTTHWSASSGGSNGASVPGQGDTVTFDGSSGGGTITLNYSPAVVSITGGAHTGTFDTGSNNISVSTFNYSGSGTKTLTLGSSTITATSTSVAWNTGTASNLTLNANTSTILLTGASASFTHSTGVSKTFNNITFTGGGTNTITGIFSVGTLTYTGTAVKTNSLTLSNNITVTAELKINGNSVINRVLFAGFTVGTAITITNTGATMTNSTNVDFRDITLGTSANLSAITGGSGDAGGNTNITFTTADDNYWIGGTGNWSTTGEWSTSTGGAADGRVPLPQDTAIFDANSFSAGSQTVTQDMPRIGSVNWTGSTNTPTWNINTVSFSIYGSVTLIADMAFVESGSTKTFRGRGSHTLTSAGYTWTPNSSGLILDAPGGTLTLQDALSIGTNRPFTITNGTFNANNFNVTVGSISSNNSNTRAITMGTGTWTLTNSGTVWTTSTITGLTFSGANSTISMTDVSTTAKTFAGGGLTFGAISITSDGSAGTTTFTGANTFSGMTIGAGGAKSIVLPGSATTVITSSTGLGNGTNLITFTASAGSATISSASGNFCWDYVSLTNIPSTGGASFYAGPTTNSTDGGGNTGWTFSSCPSASTQNYSILQIFGGLFINGSLNIQ